MWPCAACRNITGRKLDIYILYTNIYVELRRHQTRAIILRWDISHLEGTQLREKFAFGLIHSERRRRPICSSVALTNHTHYTMHTVQYFVFFCLDTQVLQRTVKPYKGNEASKIALHYDHECSTGL